MSKMNPEAPGAAPDSSYTPHEHEELESLVRKGREQLRIRLGAGHEVRASPPQPTR